MDSGNPFSKGFKKLKDKLSGDRRKRDGRSGRGNDGKGGEIEVGGSKVGQTSSFPHSDVGIGGAVGSGPSREGNDADGKGAAPVDDPLASTPSISQSGKADGV